MELFYKPRLLSLLSVLFLNLIMPAPSPFPYCFTLLLFPVSFVLPDHPREQQPAR